MAKRTNKLTAADAMINPHTEKTKSTALDFEDDGFDLSAALENDFEETITAEDVDLDELKKGKSEMYLPLGRDSADVLFKLERIPANEISNRVTIHPNNARIKEYFSELDRQEAREMLSDEQINIFPAIGVFNKNTGMIEVIDGFRRSQGCEAGGFDFQVYVANEPINPRRASSLSTNANRHVTNGLLEKRHALKREIDSLQSAHEMSHAGSTDGKFNPLSQNRIIERLGYGSKRQEFIACVRSFDVPDEVWLAFPSPATLGRNAMRKVIDHFGLQDDPKLTQKQKSQLLTDEQRATVLEKTKAFVAEQKFVEKGLSPSAANKHTIGFFEKSCKDFVVSNKPKINAAVNSLPNELGEVKSNANGSVSIKLEKLSTESVEALMSQLKAMIEDAK